MSQLKTSCNFDMTGPRAAARIIRLARHLRTSASLGTLSGSPGRLCLARESVCASLLGTGVRLGVSPGQGSPGRRLWARESSWAPWLSWEPSVLLGTGVLGVAPGRGSPGRLGCLGEPSAAHGGPGPPSSGHRRSGRLGVFLTDLRPDIVHTRLRIVYQGFFLR